MKAFAFITVLAAISAVYFIASSSVDSGLESQFHQFLAEHKKSYTSSEEYKLRMKIFSENLKAIENHNLKDSSFRLGMNKFGDMTQQEFAQFSADFVPSVNRRQSGEVDISGKPAKSIDWRKEGAVTPVINQGQCGSSWAFAASGAVEGSYAIKTGNLIKFSTQQILDCDRERSYGCNGGFMDDAFEYLEKHEFCTEESYPYTGESQDCTADSCKESYLTVSDFKDVKPNSNKALKKALNHGPVALAVDGTHQVFQFYTSGVINDDSCGTMANHGALAVGYGTNQDGIDYFIVKNTWGAEWGDKGYVNVGMKFDEDGGICGILKFDSYPIS